MIRHPDHLLERLEAAEEADDAAGPHELDQPGLHAGVREFDEGEEDNHHVQPAIWRASF